MMSEISGRQLKKTTFIYDNFCKKKNIYLSNHFPTKSFVKLIERLERFNHK